MLREWLDARTPPPPPRLAQRMSEAVAECAGGGSPGAATSSIPELLTMAAAKLLERTTSRSASSPARASALDLLAADALLTYALEAAAEDCATFVATPNEMIERLSAILV